MNIRKVIAAVALAVMPMIVFAAEPQLLSFTVLPKMTCSNCENKIKSNLRFEKGVKTIKTSIPDQRIEITFDPAKTDSTKLVSAFEKIGYKAIVVKDDKNEKK